MNRFRGERAERRSRPVCLPHTRLAPSPPPPAAMGIKARRMASPALPPAAPGAGAAAMPPHRAHRALPRSPNPRPPPTRHHQGLSKLLGDRAPACRKDQAFENYFGREVAVDASMHIYQFLVRERRGWGGWGSGWWRRTRAAAAVATTPFFSPPHQVVVGRTGDQQLTDETGEVTSHLQGMFYRTVRERQGLRRGGFSRARAGANPSTPPLPLFSTSGPHAGVRHEAHLRVRRQAAHDEARRARRARGQARRRRRGAGGGQGGGGRGSHREVLQAHGQGGRGGRGEEGGGGGRRVVPRPRPPPPALPRQVTPVHNEECKRLLRLLGVPVVDAPSEAEAQCAEIVKAGLA